MNQFHYFAGVDRMTSMAKSYRWNEAELNVRIKGMAFDCGIENSLQGIHYKSSVGFELLFNESLLTHFSCPNLCMDTQALWNG